jgi:hypothetical protein
MTVQSCTVIFYVSLVLLDWRGVAFKLFNATRKKPCSSPTARLFSILYEQRGWEKFFTVKQRGKCLFVINFTTLIYHNPIPYHNTLVCYFTILSNTIHEKLDNRININ